MLSEAYDRIAESYDEDWCGLRAGANHLALAQITEHLASVERIAAADLAVGTGEVLETLACRLRMGRCIGFDISAGMLDKARERLRSDTRLFHCSAADAMQHVPRESADLVLSHFLLRYLEPSIVLPVAHDLLKPGGYLSLITTTQQSLRETCSGRFGSVARYSGVRKQLTSRGNPETHSLGMDMVAQHGFEIVADTLFRQPVSFHSFDDVYAWAYESGWAAELMDGWFGVRALYFKTVLAMVELYMRPLYPVHATKEISVLLARKV